MATTTAITIAVGNWPGLEEKAKGAAGSWGMYMLSAGKAISSSQDMGWQNEGWTVPAVLLYYMYILAMQLYNALALSSIFHLHG